MQTFNTFWKFHLQMRIKWHYHRHALVRFALQISFSPFIPCLNVFAVVPHITDAIQEWVMEQARISVDDDGVEPQVCVIEVRSSQQVLHVEIQN